jgi:hypothetical protein
MDYNQKSRNDRRTPGVFMRRKWAAPILFICLLLFMIMLSFNTPVQAGDLGQLPTVSMATVTSTPSGPVAFVLQGNDLQINVRSGPGSLFDRVGVLLAGQSVPAKGKSPAGEWIYIEYPGVTGGRGWVYAPLVEIRPPSQLPIVEPPPTPTPAITATIDPTLAARFVVTLEPTRLPTFTQPPPLAIPTFVVNSGPSLSSLPMGFVILGLAALGIFFGIVAFAQR